MFRKSVVAFTFFATSISAWAGQAPGEWLNCSTGPALDAVALRVTSTKLEELVTLVIANRDDSTQTFTAKTVPGSKKNMEEKGEIELLLQSKKTINYGGMFSDSAFISLKREKKDGPFDGYMAANSAVYTLSCE